MGRDAQDCAAPLTATVLPVPPQKPKTVSGGGWRPAGWRARGDNAVNAHQDCRGWRRGDSFGPGHNTNIRAKSAILLLELGLVVHLQRFPASEQ